MTKKHAQVELDLIDGQNLSLSRTESPVPLKPIPRVLDLTQVAALLNAHAKTIRLMAHAGKIPGFRVGRLWRFFAARIFEWIEHETHTEAA